ncbi:OmpA family protein [Deefgea rivuli]|uniref:OmpA family protein n=1 Tax=Deefgea rivuli TaxID=400948 RepID=UPI0006842E4E|nr:OmpA family protein [Deefgea rivuli]
MKRSVLVVTAVLLGVALNGCANKPVAKSTPAPSLGSKSNTAVASAAAVVVNPYLLTFDKMSAKLTPEMEAQLQSILPKLKEARVITLRGFCNAKEVGNAKSTALARANNVEKFLIQQGIPDKKMRQKFNTEDAAHAVELDIEI